jgi:hypothetical protein
MSHPLINVFQSSLSRLAWCDRAIVNHCGRNAARTNTSRREQRELVVWHGFTGLYFRAFLDGGDDFVCALHVTSCAHAYDTGVCAMRLEREEVVKRGDSIDSTGRQFELIGNEQEQILFQIPEKLLRLVQKLDQGVVLELVLFHLHFKDFEALVTTGMFKHGMEPPPLPVCSRYVHTELQPCPAGACRLAEVFPVTEPQYWPLRRRDSTKIPGKKKRRFSVLVKALAVRLCSS